MVSMRLLPIVVGVLLIASVSECRKSKRDQTYSVAIAGAGPGGLSTAMELAERGFKVSVYEAMDYLGGKARSVGVPNTGTNGRPDLPGEHGFRIVFGFYKHLVDTLKRVPFESSSSVYDQLENIEDVGMAQENFTMAGLPATVPHNVQSFDELVKFIMALLDGQVDIPISDQLYFAERAAILAGSCEKRWDNQYDNFTYWDFFHASERSAGYRKIFVQGITRVIQGLPAKEASLRASGRTLIRTFSAMLQPNGVIWKLLNGPTSTVWINPMVNYLKSLGVQFYMNSPLIQINLDGQKISNFVVNMSGTPTPVYADFYVSSIPVEKIAPLITNDIVQAAPSLGTIQKLKENVRWMNGIQFYFLKDFPLNAGHIAWLDSKWALTGVSQPQYWPSYPVDQYGDGQVRGIVSIDISDFDAPGEPQGPSQGKAAKDCTREQLINEVYYQIGLHKGFENVFSPDKAYLHDAYLDQDISWNADGTTSNREPLFIATVHSYELLPNATTGISNFFLAADYVKGETGFASMEGANEAARYAVNGILAAVGRTDFAQLFQFDWPNGIEWEAARTADCLLYDYGKMPIGW